MLLCYIRQKIDKLTSGLLNLSETATIEQAIYSMFMKKYGQARI
jgi:hypothetical protein